MARRRIDTASQLMTAYKDAARMAADLYLLLDDIQGCEVPEEEQDARETYAAHRDLERVVADLGKHELLG